MFIVFNVRMYTLVNQVFYESMILFKKSVLSNYLFTLFKQIVVCFLCTRSQKILSRRRRTVNLKNSLGFYCLAASDSVTESLNNMEMCSITSQA